MASAGTRRSTKLPTHTKRKLFLKEAFTERESRKYCHANESKNVFNITATNVKEY